MASSAIDGIGDLALIGDCHSAALVGRSGSIGWACFPRFDSPAVFAAILDSRRGGSFEVAPEGVLEITRRYLDDTNVLVTSFECEDGAVELTDCMPVASDDAGHPSRVRTRHSLLRQVRCTRGEVDVAVSIAPRFEYGRFVPHCRLTSEESAEIVGGADALRVSATRSLDEERERIKARWRLRQGEEEWVEAAWAPSHLWPPREERPTRADHQERLEETVIFWRQWIGRCWLKDQPRVRRSALALKALIYAPTGALVAAPTTSLPESIGGQRNWDYRYTWIRDATLTLISLVCMGFRREAEAFKLWMERTSAGRPEDLQIMYGIGGERSLPELELDHLSGHLGSAPVRVGNGAAKQRQLDSFGQIVQAAYLFSKAGGTITPANWNYLEGLVELVVASWQQPDQGIWEIRDEPRHFTHSKVNCWVALDRAVRIAGWRRLPAPVGRWSAERDAIRDYLITDAERRGWFAQSVGSDDADASALLVPAVGLLPTAHPLVQKTIEVVRSELGHGGLVDRYRAGDGLASGEGAFLLCSWWLADALTFSGCLDEARSVVAEVEGYANDVGLWAEEVDPATGAALGNFPQAFTHMAHITSCLHLAAAERGETDPDAVADYAEHALDRVVAAGHRLG